MRSRGRGGCLDSVVGAWTLLPSTGRVLTLDKNPNNLINDKCCFFNSLNRPFPFSIPFSGAIRALRGQS